MTPHGERFVVLGRITGISGLQGGVKIHSYTRPREQIFSYDPWYLWQDSRWSACQARRAGAGGTALVAIISGCADRDAAAALLGADIAVQRAQLPELSQGEYYQADLIGLELLDMSGVHLGSLLEIRETGANDVMVVTGVQTILIPLVMGKVVKHIDLENGVMQVDWNPEYQ